MKSGNNANRSGNFKFLITDGRANCQTEITNSGNPREAVTNRKEWRSRWRNSRRIGRVSTDKKSTYDWSPCRLQVDSRWFLLSSSQWASSSTLCAEGRNSPFHWYTLMLPGLLMLTWMCYKRNELTIIGTSIRACICQSRGEDSQKNTLLKEKPPSGYMWSGREETDKDSKRLPD